MIGQIDKKAKEKGYLIYQSNDLYAKQITYNSEVYIQKTKRGFTAYRLTFQKGESKPISEKTIVNSTDIVNAFNKAESYIKKYLEYIKRL